MNLLRRKSKHMKQNNLIVIIAAILVCAMLVLFSASAFSIGKNNDVANNDIRETITVEENEVYLLKYQFEVGDPWIPFMDNPNTWDNTENSLGISVMCSKFISIRTYKERMQQILGEGWTFSDVPQEIFIELSSYEYLLYAEYNDDRTLIMITTNKDKSIAACVEFCYLQSEYQSNEKLKEALRMMNSFKVVGMKREVDSAA